MQVAARKTLQRLPNRARRRITRLLDYAPVRPRLLRQSQASTVVRLVPRLIADLTKLRSILPSNHFSDVIQAHELIVGVARRMRSVELDLKIRRSGRPSAYDWAVFADALFDELRAARQARKWAAVADLLRPLIAQAGAPIKADPEHLRQLVDQWNRKIRTRVRDKHTKVTWKRRKTLLRREAGLK